MMAYIDLGIHTEACGALHPATTSPSACPIRMNLVNYPY